MASGWETLIRVASSNGWLSPAPITKRGNFLFADSETLDYGAQVKEEDDKLIGVRESPASTFLLTQVTPKGAVTFEPRVDDLLRICMAHFQYCQAGGGTYVFFRSPITPDYGSQANSVYQSGTIVGGFGTAGTGTCAFGIDVDLFYGASLVSGTKANGIRFMSGIVDKLTFTQKFAEPLMCTFDSKFTSGSLASYPIGFTPLTSYGSFSEFSQFVDYQGTVTLVEGNYKLDGFEITSDNKTSDKNKLGVQGINRFPFGRYTCDGSFDLELQDDLQLLTAGQTGSLNAKWWIKDGNGTALLQIDVANLIYRPNTPQVSKADVITFSQPYRAYPTVGSICPSMIVTIVTGSHYGSSIMGFTLGA